MSLRGNALLWVVATGVLAILGTWSGQPLLARLWRVPAGLLLLALAYEAWLARRAALQLRVQTSGHWLLGRATRVAFEVGSALPRGFAVQLAPAAPPPVAMDCSVRTLHAAAGGLARLELTATARRLGPFEWPALRARVGGVFGLAWWPVRLAAARRVVVVPDRLREVERTRGSGGPGARPASRPGTGGEVLQLREWRRSDPPRAIDWKASARVGRLISRDFSEEQHLEIIVAVDAGRSSGLAAGDSDRLALYANVAARFAQRAALLDDRVGLLLYADRVLAALAPAPGAAAVARLRDALTRVRLQDVDAEPLAAAARIGSLARQRCLVVWLTDLDEAGALAELSGAVRALLPKHLPFIAAVASERVRQLAAAPVEDAAGAYRALAAQEHRAALGRHVAALRALGAQALLARPEVLDHAVLEGYLHLRRTRRVA